MSVLDERIDDGLCVFAVDPNQHAVATVTLHQGGDLAVVAAEQQITFPVAGYRPVLNLSRPLADRHRTNNAAMIGRLLRVMPGSTHAAATPEMLNQLLLQGATGLDEQRLVDRLV